MIAAEVVTLMLYLISMAFLPEYFGALCCCYPVASRADSGFGQTCHSC